MLNIILPDGAKYEGDHMADYESNTGLSDVPAQNIGRGLIPAIPRTIAVVAAELERAQLAAATVKPLREELDRLLGKRTRARKDGSK